MLKKILLLFCSLCLIVQVKAQQLVQERLYKLGNTPRVFSNSTLTRDGNLLIAGTYTANPGYQSIFALVKPNTDTLWMRTGPLLSIGGIGIKQAPGSGFKFYATKRYISPPASGTIFHTYDSQGMLRSTIPYATNAFDIGFLLLTAPDSGYFLGGNNIINGKNTRFALGRTDSLGNLKWRKRYDWSNSEFLADIQHTRNGNIIMYGVTYPAAANRQRLKLILINQNGDSVLGRQLTIIGSPNRNEKVNSSLSSILPLSDGGFLMAAEIDTNVVGAPPNLGMVVKVNANLQPVWHYIYRSVPNNVTFNRSRELTDGSVVMLAHERRGGSTSLGNQFFLYHFSPAGALLNVYTFTSTLAAQIQANTLEALSDSSFIIGGRGIVTPPPNLSSGFYVAKIKIAGLAPALPLPSPVITSRKPDLIAAKASLGQSYPNPTAAEAIIPYFLPQNYTKASILIREIATGREIRRYELKRGHSSLNVDLSNLNNGLYLYSLVVDEKPVATKKLAVMK